MENSSFPETNSSCADCTGRGSVGLNMSTPPLNPSFYVTVPVIYSVICAVGLTGNTTLSYGILKAPRMKTVTSIFILSLAIADELFTLVLPINIADYLLLQWPFGEFVCKLLISIDQCNTFSSIYFLTPMSIDRCLVVVAATQSRKMSYHTHRAAKVVSLCLVLGHSHHPAIGLCQDTQGAGVLPGPLCVPHPESSWWEGSGIYTLVLGFAIPVSTICILYTTVLCRLRPVHLCCQAKGLDKAKEKVMLMVAVILALCLFCWTPHPLSTVLALPTDIPQTPLLVGVSYFITSLSYASSCFNPVLDAFLDDDFWRSFLKLMDCRSTS